MTSSFERGREAVKEEVASGHIYDVAAAFESFKGDRPDSEWMWGYFSALHDIIFDGEVTDYEKLSFDKD